MITKRWKVSFDGGVTYGTIVTPLNSAKFSRARDLRAGQIFRRRKLNTKLEFGKPDFALFYDWERTSVRRCNDIFIRQYRLCSGRWKEFWTGRFSAGSGGYDLDNCRFEVKPEVYDRYSCILDHIQDKVNILAVEPVDASAIIMPPNLQFGVCATVGAVPEPPGACDEFWSPPPTEINGWDAVHSQAIAGGQLNIFMRERVVTDCVGGNPIPPPGTGWALLTDNCALDGTAVYVRQSTVPYTFGDASQGTMSGSTPVPPDGTCNWVFIGIAGVDDPFNPGPDSYGPWFICPNNGTPVDYDRARLLLDVFNHMLEKTGCELTGVVSDFFDWNPLGDAPGYVSGENYITGRANQVNQLLILQKSDAIDPAASNPATIGELTLAGFFEFARKVFNVFWDIDDAGNVRLEHWRYWTFAETLDLTVGFNAELSKGMNRFEHLSDQIPSRERFSMAEALGADFVGKDIFYDSPCVSKEDRDSVEETRLDNFTTDLSYISTDPDAISTSGFVVLAALFDATTYNVILDTGAITGAIATNAPLSWANLHRDFFTWNRYLRRGNLNGVDVIFDGYLPNIQQPVLRAEFCCGMEEWDANGTVKTELGERFLNQRQGFVEKDEVDDATDQVSITLRYAY